MKEDKKQVIEVHQHGKDLSLGLIRKREDRKEKEVQTMKLQIKEKSLVLLCLILEKE